MGTPSARPWFAQAAILYADQKRGLYDWGDRKPPKNKDGSPRVVKTEILVRLGLDPRGHNLNERVWSHPEFLRLLNEEERRRDMGIANMVAEVEKEIAPLNVTYVAIDKHIKAIFERGPDSDDPECLSPKDYVHEGLAVMKHIEEQEGRSASLNAQGLDAVIAAVGANITGDMVSQARELLVQSRALQDRRLAHVIEGSCEDD
jgi:hypothetical protein